MKHSGLAIIECQSKDSTPGSLLGHYGLVAATAWATPHKASGNIVENLSAFRTAYLELAADPRCRVLCVAGHGRCDEVKLLEGPPLRIVDLQSLIAESERTGGGFEGIHFSTCSTLTYGFAKAALSSARELRWVSGYRKETDWVFGLALDMMFLAKVLDYGTASKDAVHRVAKFTRKRVGGMAKLLGLAIFVPRSGSPLNLLGETAGKQG